MKVCQECGKELNKSSSNKTKRCRECYYKVGISQKKIRKDHPSKEEKIEKEKKYKAKWYIANKESVIKACVQRNRERPERVRFGNQIKSVHGISLDQYDQILAEQDFKCKICPTLHVEEKGKRLYVDHCHETLEIRGLLCHSCNVAIGHFKDNIELLQNAINYLNNEKKTGYYSKGKGNKSNTRR